MMNKKKLSIILLIMSAILVVAGIVFLVYLNIRPSKPSSVIVAEEKGRVIFRVEEEPNEQGFIFKFRQGNKKILVYSDLPILEFTSSIEEKGIELGKEYYISVCRKGEVEGGDSYYSKEIKWRAKKYLASPSLSINSEYLQWTQVDDADFYKLCYKYEDELMEITVEQNQYRLDLLKGGNHDIFVIASSNKDYYIESKSNVLSNIKVVHEIPSFVDVKFDKESKLLTLYSNEQLSSIKVYLGNNEIFYTNYTIVNLSNNYIDGRYEITCSLNLIYSNQSKIGVLPNITDEYNKFTGSIFWIDV